MLRAGFLKCRHDLWRQVRNLALKTYYYEALATMEVRACKINPQDRGWGRSSASLTISYHLDPERLKNAGSDLYRCYNLAYSSQSQLSQMLPWSMAAGEESGPENGLLRSFGHSRDQFLKKYSLNNKLRFILSKKALKEVQTMRMGFLPGLLVLLERFLLPLQLLKYIL